MPVTAAWYDDEHTIIKVTIAPDMTWDAYHQIVDWIVTEAAKVEHRVDIIFHDDVGMPKGNPLPHLTRGSARIIEQRNIHSVIIAGSRGHTGFVRMMLEALAKSFMKMPRSGEGTLLFMRNVDEALAHIRKDRSKTTTA